LLHFERGRISHRYIFGPQRLHYGLFQLKASHSTYITATRDDVLEGAIGFMFDPHEKLVKVLEVISLDERCIQFLLKRLLLTCNALKAAFIEVDVSAYAPGFQRSLYALGFRPMAYIPAMVFHQVERLDVLRMGLVLCDASESQDEFIASNQTIADLVKESCYTKELS